MLAIIGGSGLSRLPGLDITHRQVMRTPYGEPSCPLSFGQIAGRQIVFLARHGYGHSLAPHEINYRANIWALAEIGVSGILAVGSVGGIHPELTTGVLAVPDQIIDYTHSRAATFFEGPDQPVVHVDFSYPYDATLRCRLLEAAATLAISVHDGGCYAATQGPRFRNSRRNSPSWSRWGGYGGDDGNARSGTCTRKTLTLCHISRSRQSGGRVKRRRGGN